MEPIKRILFVDPLSEFYPGTGVEADIVVVAGSRLFGLNTEKSDYDYVAVILPPVSNLCSMNPFEHMVHDFRPPYEPVRDLRADSGSGIVRIEFNTEADKDVDLKVYSLSKFFRMLMNKDVSSFETLFSTSFTNLTERGARITGARSMFLAREKLHARFRGYAENERRVALGHTTGTLGEDRKYDMSKYGYSVKNAAACIRLLIEGTMLLLTGDMKFPFEPEILSILRRIRLGETSVAEFEAEYALRMEAFLHASDCSPLPEHVDPDEIDRVYRNLCLRK